MTFNSPSYFPNYYSIDDIFVTQEKVMTTVTRSLPKMGAILDPEEDECVELPYKKKVEVPLWYLEDLSTGGLDIPFIVEIPNIYKNVFKEICRADATAVELGKVNKYFYEFGLYLTCYDVNNIVGSMIFETCRQRSRFLSTITKSTSKDFSMDNRLDNIENQLYAMGCKSSRLFSEWLMIDNSNIQTSDLVSNYKKRKRSALEEAK